MIQILSDVEEKLHSLITDSKFNSMYINYHKPFVSRIWFQYGEYRVYLHKIFACKDSEVLYHPHPWQSAIRIIKGRYEMGIGHSKTKKSPITDCKLILPSGTLYEMTEEDSWHYVNPLQEPVYSLMITGKKNERKMPLEPKKDFRTLGTEEYFDILTVFNEYYNWQIPPEEITNLIMKKLF